jgi:non-specific protein-tyrosine kinase
MELRYILNLIRRWGWLLVLGALLGAGAGFGVSLLLAPVYEAQATILLNQASSPAGPQYTDLLAGDRLGKTYVDLILRRDVLQLAIAELQLPLTPDELAAQADAEQIRDTQLLAVRVRNSDPARAADLANRLCTVFIARIGATTQDAFTARRTALEAELAANEQQYQTANEQLLALTAKPAATLTIAEQAEVSRLTGLVAQYSTTRDTLLRTLDSVRQGAAGAASSLVLVDPAIPPSAPIFPRIPLNLALGLVAGLALAAGLVWLLEQLDDRLRTPAAVQDVLGLPVLSSVPRTSPAPPAGLAPTQTPVAEAYRFLRTNIDFSNVDQPPRLLLIVETTTAGQAIAAGANLAVAAAAAGRRVLLVDADLRASTVHGLFRLPPTPGLTSLLLEPDPVPQPPPAREVPNLWVLPPGPIPPNPSDVLGSQKMAALLQALRVGYDQVIVVAPALPVFPDALALAPQADGVVLVLDAPTTRRAAALAAVTALRQVGAPILGVLLDRVRPAAGPTSLYFSTAPAVSPAARSPAEPGAGPTGHPAVAKPDE